MADATTVKKSPSLKTILGWLLCIAVPVIILLIPASELFTPGIKTTLAILAFVMINFGFELMESTMTALILPLMFILTGAGNTQQAFSGFANATIWGSAGAMALVGCMSNTNIMKKLSYGTMLRSGGSIKGICMAFGIVGLILSSVLCGGISVAFIVIAYALIVSLDIPMKSNAAAAIMMSAFMATNGPMAYFMNPITTMAINVAKSADPNISISYTQYLAHNWPMAIYGLFTVALPFLLLKKDVEFSAKEVVEKEYRAIPKFALPEAKMIIILVVVLITLLTNSIHKVDFSWVMLAAAIVCFIPAVGLGDKKALSAVNWNNIVFMACCLSIGAVFNAVGATEWLVSIVGPLVSGVGKIVGCFMIWLVGVIANFMLTPLAAQAALINPLVGIGNSIGISTEVVVYIFRQGVNQLLLPYEIAVPMLMFSYGTMSLKQFMKVNGVAMITNLIFVMAVMVPYWLLIGIL